MWSLRHPALPGPLPWAKWKGQHRIVRQMPLAFPGRPDCLRLCSDGWSGTLGRTGLRLIVQVGLISLLGVLLVVALIKRCMRLTDLVLFSVGQINQRGWQNGVLKGKSARS